MKFLAHFQEMAASEIKGMISAYTFESIKKKDPNPIFKAYVVGEEGKSKGKVIGYGNIVKTWFASAIGKIIDKLWPGLPVFHNHTDDNRHEGRTQIGEVVGAKAKEIKEKLTAFAAVYIYPEYKGLPLDVASIEANIELDLENGGIHAVDVKDITGIALGNSAVQKPGFANATLQGELQAFVQSHQFNKRGGEMATISEVRDFIKAENLKPSDIFGLGDLTKDPMIEEHIEQAKKDALKGEYEHRKRDEAGFDKTKEKMVEDHKKELKDKDDQITKLRGENIQSKTGTWLEAQKTKRELDEEQMKYINRNLPKFKPEDPEKAEDEFNKFLDGQIDELAGIKKEVFGEEPPEKKEKIGGGEPKDKKGGEDVIEDMSLED